MARFILSALALASFTPIAQATTPPLDPLPKQTLSGVGYWWNGGQADDLQGNALNNIRYYSDGILPHTGLLDGGRLAIVNEIFSPDTLLPDTLHRFELFPVNAAQVAPMGIELSTDYMNFYLPHTLPNGVENVQCSRYVVYSAILPGVDMWVYAGKHRQRIAFVCAPGVDPSIIELAFEGLNNGWLDANGRIILELSNGIIELPQPLMYQDNAGTVEMLTQQTSGSLTVPSGSYDGLYALPQVSGQDPALPTIVLFAEEEHEQGMLGGPGNGLCWSNYYGGNRLDWITESAKDWRNNYYVTGWTRSSPQSFPANAGGPTVFLTGSYYATLSQFDNQEFLIWTAMIGGGGNTFAYSQAIAVRNMSPSSTIYIGGIVTGAAPNFYTYLAPGSPAYFDNTATPGNTNGFICRFNDAGALEWSTYWGDWTNIEGMAISDRRLIVTGNTRVPLPTPVSPPPFGATSWPAQSNLAAFADAYVCAFDFQDRTHWLCYLGGDRDEGGFDVRCEGADIYVLGTTGSTNFPTVALPGAFNDNSFAGGGMLISDAFIARFNSNFTILWNTYFGGSDGEVAGSNGLAISPVNGDVYIVGTVRFPQTTPSGFPLQQHPNGLAYFDGIRDPGNNGFIAHFRGYSNNLIWCTYFGDFDWFHWVHTVTVGSKDGLVYVAGATQCQTLPVMQSTNYTYYQPNIDPNDGQVNDAFVVMFKGVDDVMNWCTYFGGNAGLLWEHIRTLVAKEGALFAAGITSKYSDLASFFPLQDDVIPGNFYDDIFGDFASPTYDGFLTKFCTPWSDLDEGGEKSISITGEAVNGTLSYWLANGVLNVSGCKGPGTFLVFAADGRLAADQRFEQADGSSLLKIYVGHLRSGVYSILLSTGERGRFIVP